MMNSSLNLAMENGGIPGKVGVEMICGRLQSASLTRKNHHSLRRSVYELPVSVAMMPVLFPLFC